MTTETIKLQLVQTIINLPENQLATASEFLSRLVSDDVSGVKNRSNDSAPILTSEENPMLKFIGLASYDPPNTSIDDELYGG